METYVIKYEIILTDGSVIRDKEMKVKNCQNGVHAQIKLEDYLSRKYKNFSELIVNSCEEDMFSYLNCFSDDFDEIFKGQDLTAGGSKWHFN